MNFRRLFSQFFIKRLITIIVLLLVMAIVGCIFIISPAIDKLSQLKNDINQKVGTDKAVDYKDGSVYDVKTAVEELNKANQSIKRVDKIFINEYESIKFVENLERLAFENNLEQKIEILPMIGASKTGYYRKVPIKLSISGRQSDALNLITAYEEMDYYLNIRDINIFLDNTESNIQVKHKESLSIRLDLYAISYWK
jgi:Tfp pilus assembly protein PilO